jgi:hypothetical protein
MLGRPDLLQLELALDASPEEPVGEPDAITRRVPTGHVCVEDLVDVGEPVPPRRRCMQIVVRLFPGHRKLSLYFEAHVLLLARASQ